MNAYKRYQEMITNGQVDEARLDYTNSVAERMDPQLRARVLAMFDGIPGIDSGDFLRFYCDLHRAKYGEEFPA